MMYLLILSLWAVIKQVEADCAPRTEPLDVYFAMDESGSVNTVEWQQQRVFLSKLIDNGMSHPQDRIGVTQWSSGNPVSKTEFTYNDSKDAIVQGVLTINRKPGSSTYTDNALRDALEAILAEPVVPGRKRMVVLLTDGVPGTNHGPCGAGGNTGDLTVVQDYQNAGIEIGVIAIGDQVHGHWNARFHLSCLVDNPDEDINVMDNFSTFDQYRDPTGGFLCVNPQIFTETPTANPTPMPTPNPTPAPTPAPTANPTPMPTPAPTANPTPMPSANPTPAPTDAPTSDPTPAPTSVPTANPTPAPTDAPTSSPTFAPTDAPTSNPTPAPTDAPTASPTPAPTNAPTNAPTAGPTVAPSLAAPTAAPVVECDTRTTPLDAYFAVDGSRSIDDVEWEAQRNFISQLIRYGMDNPADRVGVTAWASKSQKMHAFDFSHGIQNVPNDVLSLERPDHWSSTHTSKAILYSLDRMAQEPVVAGHVRKLILVTDGVPSNIHYEPCLNQANKDTILAKLAQLDISMSVIAIDGSEPLDFVGKLSCLVEDPSTDITVMADFDSFHTYRDPTGGLLCVDPVKVAEKATPAPTMTPAPTKCTPTFVEPASPLDDVCSKLSRKNCNANSNCVKEGKKCLGKDLASTSCYKAKSDKVCSSLERCQWGQQGCFAKGPAQTNVVNEATCKADFCAKYTWYGGESQCDYDFQRDGCGCKGLDADQCSSNPKCEMSNCSCQEKDVCGSLSVTQCLANDACLVHDGGCSKKCELGPNQSTLPANVMLAFDQRNGECYLQTNVDGGCGCNNA